VKFQTETRLSPFAWDEFTRLVDEGHWPRDVGQEQCTMIRAEPVRRLEGGDDGRSSERPGATTATAASMTLRTK